MLLGQTETSASFEFLFCAGTSTMKPLKRNLAAVWATLGVAPGCLTVLNGATRTAPLLLLYIAGTLVLLTAIRREQCGLVLAGFGRTKTAYIAMVALLFLLLISAFASSITVAYVLIGTLTLFFVLWTLSASSADLTRRVGRVLLVGNGFVFGCLTLEVMFRAPIIVARTGGNTPGMIRWEKANYDFVWRGNPAQLRSLHLDSPKLPGGFRIVTVGDSFTWGDKIARTEDIWPYVLEGDLTENGVAVEVINISQRAYTTVNEAEALDRFGWPLKPDLVIVQSLINDSFSSRSKFRMMLTNDVFQIRPLCHGGLGKYLEVQSYSYSFLNSHFRRYQMKTFHPEGYAPLFEESFQGWQDCQAALAKIQRQGQQRHVPVIVVQFPLFTPGVMREDTYEQLAAHRKLLEGTTNAGLATFDLLPVFCELEKDGRDWWALPCDGHPNEEAHAVAGHAVAKELLRRDLLPSPGTKMGQLNTESTASRSGSLFLAIRP